VFNKSLRKLATVLFCICPLATHAVTHDVTVGNNFFDSNDLTIAVGDTVRWTNTSGFHDVTADDFSWMSETSNNFVYERTFDTVEEVLYHCTVHSSPGQDIQTRMNGRINVVETDVETVLINAGMNDAWWNEDTDGQGFLITVFEELVFLAWFTFDVERPPENVTAILGDPGHRWVTAAGPYDGDTATLTVTVTSGGVFDSPEPVVERAPDGTMTIQWHDCNSATLTYDIPSAGQGVIELTRVALDNVALCEML